MNMRLRQWIVGLVSLALMSTPIPGFSQESISLSKAVINEDFPAAEKALLRGESPNAVDPALNHSPLHIAVAPGGPRSSTMLKLMAQNKADLNATDPESKLTPLMASMVIEEAGPFAVLESAKANMLFELLLELGANPNKPGTDGVTPLMLATEMGNAGYVRTLIAHGADPNAQDVYGQTPLHMTHGLAPDVRQSIRESLLAAGANPAIRNRFGLKEGETSSVAPTASSAPTGTLTGTATQTATDPASPAANTMQGQIAPDSPAKNKWSKWLTGGAIVAAAIAGGIILAAAVQENKQSSFADLSVQSQSGNPTIAPVSQTTGASARPTVVWDTTQVSTSLQYHQMKVCFGGGNCTAVGRKIRHELTKAVFLIPPSNSSGSGWTTNTPLFPSELFWLYKGFNSALEIAWSGTVKPTTIQIESLLNDAFARGTSAINAISLATQSAQKLAGSTSTNVVLAKPLNIRPVLSWSVTSIATIRPYVLQMCLGTCRDLSGPVMVDTNPNDTMTAEGFAAGIRWAANSPVQMATLADLKSRLEGVLSKVWTGQTTPDFDIIEKVLHMALATGTSITNVEDIALKEFARRGFPSAPAPAPGTAVAGACGTTYSGPLDDPQTSTFCRQAYSYTCLGDTVNASKVCTLLNTTLSAFGTGQTASQYCTNYCR